MVPDLNTYKSHPDKALEVHILGVTEKALKRFDSPLVRWAALFHDLGKINPNFQRKLAPGYMGGRQGYDEHAYLSAWAWVCFLNKNLKTHQQLGRDLGGSIIKLQIILTLIAKHHGNLPDFEKLLKGEPVERLRTFIKSHSDLPLSAFLEKKLVTPHEPFHLVDNEWAARLIVFTQKEKWREKALDYYLDTQFGFASLIEGDKRDAGDKYVENYYHLEATNEGSANELAKNLVGKWQWLAAKHDKSELDELRTAIREEAVEKLGEELPLGKRVFTLTAPTGAGKTFTLLALAAEIQRQKPGMSILYALPFLSITEQVEGIVQSLLKEVLSATSKSKNQQMDELIEKLESNPEPEDFKELLKQDFIQQTFDHPFVVTTFVQFFETLLSNRNSTLLKLPNFSRRIFLIDEIQALPPRLYIFFAAWLDAFCRRWDSYAILSTATMPKMDYEVKTHIEEKQKPEKLFKGYLENTPTELLNYRQFFSAFPFNRYRIRRTEPFELTMDELAGQILRQEQSCLVIVNTIRDSRDLFEKLLAKTKRVYLLNTHFIPVDRQRKIELIKVHLDAKEKVVLVSTQLIEAGVDIDFPMVFRDLCPLPSLIQSAGRCNRNKKLPDLGQVWFFHLKKENGKSGAEAVYRDEAKLFLDFSKKHIRDDVEESTLLDVQDQFFRFIADNLMIGDYEIEREKVNLIELVNEAAFETLGKFKLIQEKVFGFEFQYFIPESEDDDKYDKTVELLEKTLAARDFVTKRQWKIQLTRQLKKVLERTITIRTFDKDNVPAPANPKEYFDIRVLADLDLYTFERGFLHDTVQNAFV
jgi:CRISPR-associated endonuclease/helicase Cas3